MKEILSKREIKLTLEKFKGELDYEEITYSDVNFNEVKEALTAGPAIKYLPLPEDNTEEVPVLNEKGNYEYRVDNEIVVVPEQYVPAIKFSSRNFPGLSTKGEQIQKLFGKIWSYIRDFMGSVFTKNKTIYSQLKDILVNSDKYYIELRDRIYGLEKDYAKESIFEVLFFIPDCFIYLCRLLKDIRVPMDYKIEIVFALIYMVSPIDFIPEGLINHPIALMDDIGISIYVIKKGFDSKVVPRDLLENNWPGDVEFIDQIDKWYRKIEETVGEDLIEMIRSYHKKKSESI